MSDTLINIFTFSAFYTSISSLWSSHLTYHLLLFTFRTYSSNSVSYTHLDVYKRQAVDKTNLALSTAILHDTTDQ